ncbi:hypothetical protein ILUMI_23641, partial [Ignelater luminosus]
MGKNLKPLDVRICSSSEFKIIKKDSKFSKMGININEFQRPTSKNKIDLCKSSSTLRNSLHFSNDSLESPNLKTKYLSRSTIDQKESKNYAEEYLKYLTSTSRNELKRQKGRESSSTVLKRTSRESLCSTFKRSRKCSNFKEPLAVCNLGYDQDLQLGKQKSNKRIESKASSRYSFCSICKNPKDRCPYFKEGRIGSCSSQDLKSLCSVCRKPNDQCPYSKSQIRPSCSKESKVNTNWTKQSYSKPKRPKSAGESKHISSYANLPLAKKYSLDCCCSACKNKLHYPLPKPACNTASPSNKIMGSSVKPKRPKSAGESTSHYRSSPLQSNSSLDSVVLVCKNNERRNHKSLCLTNSSEAIIIKPDGSYVTFVRDDKFHNPKRKKLIKKPLKTKTDYGKEFRNPKSSAAASSSSKEFNTNLSRLELSQSEDDYKCKYLREKIAKYGNEALDKDSLRSINHNDFKIHSRTCRYFDSHSYLKKNCDCQKPKTPRALTANSSKCMIDKNIVKSSRSSLSGSSSRNKVGRNYAEGQAKKPKIMPKRRSKPSNAYLDAKQDGSSKTSSVVSSLVSPNCSCSVCNVNSKSSDLKMLAATSSDRLKINRSASQHRNKRFYSQRPKFLEETRRYPTEQAEIASTPPKPFKYSQTKIPESGNLNQAPSFSDKTSRLVVSTFLNNTNNQIIREDSKLSPSFSPLVKEKDLMKKAKLRTKSSNEGFPQSNLSLGYTYSFCKMSRENLTNTNLKQLNNSYRTLKTKPADKTIVPKKSTINNSCKKRKSLNSKSFCLSREMKSNDSFIKQRCSVSKSFCDTTGFSRQLRASNTVRTDFRPRPNQQFLKIQESTDESLKVFAAFKPPSSKLKCSSSSEGLFLEDQSVIENRLSEISKSGKNSPNTKMPKVKSASPNASSDENLLIHPDSSRSCMCTLCKVVRDRQNSKSYCDTTGFARESEYSKPLGSALNLQRYCKYSKRQKSKTTSLDRSPPPPIKIPLDSPLRFKSKYEHLKPSTYYISALPQNTISRIPSQLKFTMSKYDCIFDFLPRTKEKPKLKNSLVECKMSKALTMSKYFDLFSIPSRYASSNYLQETEELKNDKEESQQILLKQLKRFINDYFIPPKPDKCLLCSLSYPQGRCLFEHPRWAKILREIDACSSKNSNVDDQIQSILRNIFLSDNTCANETRDKENKEELFSKYEPDAHLLLENPEVELITYANSKDFLAPGTSSNGINGEERKKSLDRINTSSSTSSESDMEILCERVVARQVNHECIFRQIENGPKVHIRIRKPEMDRKFGIWQNDKIGLIGKKKGYRSRNQQFCDMFKLSLGYSVVDL